MKFVLALYFALLSAATLASSTYVQGYTRKDGTYVPGYYRTQPNETPYDNYSTKGNTNPYTGEKGYVDPDGVGKVSDSPNK